MENIELQNSVFKEKFEKLKVILLDLDGTIYIGDKLIDGAKDALDFFRKNGKQLVFLTNNSSKTDEEYVKKLSALGVYKSGDAVYTSGDAALEYLIKFYAEKRVFLLADDKLKDEFSQAGVILSDTEPEIALLAYDTTLTFEKIKTFDKFLKKGVLYLATHPDAVCPAPDYSMPDVGSFIEMFYKSSGRRPDKIIGKPNTIMGDMVKYKYSVTSDEVMMVGDRMYTDIRFAINNGFNSMAVLSGETSLEDYLNGETKATFVFDDISKCLKFFN